MFYKRAVASDELDEQTSSLYERLYFDLMQQQGVNGLRFYQTTTLPLPSGDGALPVVNISSETTDGCLWIALLARQQDVLQGSGDPLRDVRSAIAGKTLTLGIMPLVDDSGIHIAAGQTDRTEVDVPVLWETIDPNSSADNPNYVSLRTQTETNFLAEPGYVEIGLPSDEQALQVWPFEPGEEGIGDAPPSLSETDIGDRVVTWIRMRLADKSVPARISWVGANALPIVQQVQIIGEEVGTGTGQPDQCLVLANTPVIPETLQLQVNGEVWHRVDDILTAAPEVIVHDSRTPLYEQNEYTVAYLNPAQAYTLDPESGEICFGDGAHGKRPPANSRITASYTFGGGRQGNVGIGAINKSPPTAARFPN